MRILNASVGVEEKRRHTKYVINFEVIMASEVFSEFLQFASDGNLNLLGKKVAFNCKLNYGRQPPRQSPCFLKVKAQTIFLADFAKQSAFF